MNTFQKAGGFAALYNALAYICGMVFFLGIINYPAITDSYQMIASLHDHQSTWYSFTLMNYVFFGFSLIILATALKNRLMNASPVMMQITTVVAYVWAGLLIGSGMVFNVGMKSVLMMSIKDPAGAALIWQGIDAVHSGLSGNGEIVGGLWTLLVSLVAFRSKNLQKSLNYLGIVVGFIGIISVVPVLEDFMGLFGIGQIIWFIWLGIVLLTKKSTVTGNSTDPVLA